jgi:hypothetical protein
MAFHFELRRTTLWRQQTGGAAMTFLSRRTVLKTSPLAAIALCLPGPLYAARTTDPAPMGENGTLERGLVDAIAEALRQSRAYTVECATAMPENKYNFRPVPEVRSFGQQMVHISEANGSIMEMHVEGKQKMSWPYSGDGKERVTSKSDVIAQLNASYDYIQKGLSQITDRMLLDRLKTEMGEYTRYWDCT